MSALWGDILPFGSAPIPPELHLVYRGAVMSFALAAADYAVLYLTTCPKVPPGLLILITCPWQSQIVGILLLAVLTSGVPFLLGVRMQGWWVGVLPPLSYAFALFLWQATRVYDSYGYNLTYGLSPVEFLVFRVGVYWTLMVVSFAIGHELH